jgi:TrmH family RNA methyltransferase
MHEPTQPAAPVPQVLARIRALAHWKVRESTGSFWVEGVRQFVQAFDASYPFDTVVFSRRLLKSDLAEMLVRRLGARGVRRVAVTPEQFRSVSMTERASGIGAVVRQRWTPLGDVPVDRPLLVIESLRSAGNLGTILRTAEATGAGAVVFLTATCDPFAPAVVRASMGGIFHLRLVRTGYAHFATWAAARGVAVVGLSPEAPRPWTELDSAGPVAVVIGEGRGGLTPAGTALCGQMVRLPMCGRADSLNVGVAAGVMLYELVRRQHQTAASPPLPRTRGRRPG